MDGPPVDDAHVRSPAGGDGPSTRSLRRDRCANCGTVLSLTDRHVVAAPADCEDVYPFCRAACRATWLGVRE